MISASNNVSSSFGLFQNGSARLLASLAAICLISLFGQEANGQNSQSVNLSVTEINKIILPGSYTLSIDPTTDDNFVATGTSQGYKVISNNPNGKRVEVSITNVSNISEVENLSILSGGTAAPGQASVDSDIALITSGSESSNLPQSLTTSFTGVKSSFLPIQFRGEVSPDFDPNNTDATVTIQFTFAQ